MKTFNPKKLLIFAQLFVMLAFGSAAAFASDYQYKVLDTKYNPAAEQLLNGTIPKEEPIVAKKETKGFDFSRFLAILAMIMFPYFVFKISAKTFTKVVDSLKNRGEFEEKTEEETPNAQIQEPEENKIAENPTIIEKIETKPIKKVTESPQKAAITSPVHKEIKKFNKIDTIQKTEKAVDEVKNKVETVEIEAEKTKITDDVPQKTQNIAENSSAQPQKAEESSEKAAKNIENDTKELLKEAKINKKNATTPLNKKNPILLNTAKLSEDKGFCIVEYKNKYSLIGYIKEKVFLLNQFDSLCNAEIRPRYTETYHEKERYIIRLGTSYKALVEVGEKDINLLMEL